MFDSKSYTPLIIKLALVTILLIPSSCSNIENDKDLNEGGIALERLSSFPDEEAEVFIGIPTNAAFSESAVFIPDQASNEVHHFDLQGSYMGQIGRPGRGPGELGLPGRASFHNGDLWIYDIGNARFWRWSEEDNITEIFQASFIPRSFTAGDDYLYKTRLDEAGSNGMEESGFITRFDFEMNKIDSFGESLKGLVPGIPSAISASQLKWFENELYVLFQNFPFLHVYNSDGELIRKIEFDLKYNELAEANYRPEVFSDPSRIRLRPVFSAYDVTKEGIFIIINNVDNSLVIDQYSHSGSYKRRYKTEGKNDLTQNFSSVRQLKVQPDEYNSVRFFILGIMNDEPAVHVFTADL
ncbi:MAG: 6-bladed beta-propeller [Balneolia bacterium]|nr:6-bladed beta-propeller [Balneolia bacterium]